MKLFDAISTALIFRQIEKHLSSIASSQKTIAELLERQWEEDHPAPRLPSPGKKVVISDFDLDAAEKLYEEEQEQRKYGG